MTNHKGVSCFAVAAAFAAIGLWWGATSDRREAERERDRIRHDLVAGRASLRKRESRDVVPSLKSATDRQATTTALTVADPNSARSGAEAKAAVRTAREAAIAEALLTQRVRRLMNLEINLRPKFEALGLSNEQWNRYQILSLEKIDREDEAKRTGKQGWTPGIIEAAVRDAGAESVAALQALVGPEAYGELQRFQSERSDAIRQTVESLSSRLMFSSAPLESWQREKLAQVFRARWTVLSAGEEMREGNVGLWNELQGVLTPPQMRAWERLQHERRLMNDANVIAKRLEVPKSAPAR